MAVYNFIGTNDLPYTLLLLYTHDNTALKYLKLLICPNIDFFVPYGYNNKKDRSDPYEKEKRY